MNDFLSTPMNDFLRYILNHLKGAAAFAVIAALAALFAVAAAAVIFRVKYGKTRKFPLLRALSMLALAACAASILYLTLLRGALGAAANLHLFRAWREAWNTFEFKPWANVLLNVLMFVPLGAFLPLSFGICRRPYVSLPIVLAATSLIETAQLLLECGTFDVDDIFCNALGGAVGYLSVMAILSACGKCGPRRARTALLYAAFPTAAALSISMIFVVYYARPYGNLASAPAYRVDMSGVEVDVSCPLSNESPTVSVYRTHSLDRDDCDAMAREILSRFGMTDEHEKNGFYYVGYYDNAAFYSCQTVGSVMIEMRDGSYELSLYSLYDCRSAPGLDRSAVVSILSEIGVDVPDEAAFIDNGDGAYSFALARGASSLSGTLLCRVVVDGDGAYRIEYIDCAMVECERVADRKIISQSEAMDRLRRGDFTGEYLVSAHTLAVTDCILDYELDSKGFYRPVWLFTVNGDAVAIEA